MPLRWLNLTAYVELYHFHKWFLALHEDHFPVGIMCPLDVQWASIWRTSNAHWVKDIKWPIQPRKLIQVWIPPSPKTILFNLLFSDSFHCILLAFWYNGWSKVNIGSTLYLFAWPTMKYIVESINQSLS